MKQTELTKDMRWHIADRLAEERLDKVNQIVKEAHPRNTIYSRYIKRGLDIIFASIALILTLPINFVMLIITFFDVGLPVFFHQDRLGKNGKLFRLTKFRNMRNTRDKRGELLPAEKRVTKFGKFARKMSLDELLNFWSILKGDMSIIGPRPLVPEYKHRYNKRHYQRMAVRPGLECPPRNLSDHVWTWQEQFENDIWYVEHISFITDCKMAINLVRFALDRKSAKARANVKRGTFCGYDLNGKAITYENLNEEKIDELVK
ncbi:MAG: sugar transferase [Ruminococcus sp.]|nr:sugar transferase [Ruminococcus sp.]